MNGNGKDFFSTLLPNDILVEHTLNFCRFWHGRNGREGIFLVPLFSNDIIAQVNTFITDVDGRASDEFTHFVLAFATEGTNQVAWTIIPMSGHSRSS
jgi:hypothetical protein